MIKNFKSDKDYSKLNYCIDTIKDFNRLEAITKISGNEITWQELVEKILLRLEKLNVAIIGLGVRRKAFEGI